MPSSSSEVSFSTAKPVLFIIAGMALLLILLIGYIWIGEGARTPLKAVYRTLDTSGLIYTVIEAFHADSIGAAAREGVSYAVVCLRIQNRAPRWIEHAVRFRLVDSRGRSYDMTGFETVLANDDFYRHFDLLKESASITSPGYVPPPPGQNLPPKTPPSIAPLVRVSLPLRFSLLRESSESISLVFEVPKESLNRTWTLLVRDRDDTLSIGAIQVGSIPTSAESE